MATDLTKDFILTIPGLTPAQIVLVMNQLMIECYKRMMV